MSVENVKKFYEAVSRDKSLKQKFVELSRKYQEQAQEIDRAAMMVEQEVLPMAQGLGFSFTFDELKAFEKEMQQTQMNVALKDSELEVVSGGGVVDWCYVSAYHGY